jgi:hypothetical protein
MWRWCNYKKNMWSWCHEFLSDIIPSTSLNFEIKTTFEGAVVVVWGICGQLCTEENKTTNGYQCSCSPGFQLEKDQYTCKPGQSCDMCISLYWFFLLLFLTCFHNNKKVSFVTYEEEKKLPTLLPNSKIVGRETIFFKHGLIKIIKIHRVCQPRF